MARLKDHQCICHDCKINSKDKIFTGFGKKTKFILENKSGKVVDKYIVDDCLLKLKKEDEKCDFLFKIEEDKTVYIVECKGSDVLKAVCQINSTMQLLKDDFVNYKIIGRIVTTKVYAPDLREADYRKLKLRLNGNLETKNITCTEII